MARVETLPGMGQLLGSPGGEIDRLMERVGQAVRRRAQGLAAEKLKRGPGDASGQHYHDGFRVNRIAGLGREIENRAEHAMWLELGTFPHQIVPKRANGILRFQVGGRWVYARQVSHPGTKPYRILTTALEDTMRGGLS